jgi:hypothetical protein
MSHRFLRIVAIVVLGVQALPAGLPLLCEQVRPSTADDCAQEMAIQHHGPAMQTATSSSSCADSAFCPTHLTAVATLNDSGLLTTPETPFASATIADFTPADPQAPLPPPPQA